MSSSLAPLPFISEHLYTHFVCTFNSVYINALTKQPQLAFAVEPTIPYEKLGQLT